MNYELQLEWFDSLPDILPSAPTVRKDRTKKHGVPRRNTKKEFLLERDGNKCKLCGEKMSKNTISIDHIQPRSKGGSNEIENLQLAHIRCNGRKGNMWEVYQPN